MRSLRSLIFGDSTNPVDELKTIFFNSDNHVEAALAWARDVLQRKEIDPEKNSLSAVRELRNQEPALGLKTATYIVKKLSLN